jgi:hypothetical protein
VQSEVVQSPAQGRDRAADLEDFAGHFVVRLGQLLRERFAGDLADRSELLLDLFDLPLA